MSSKSEKIAARGWWMVSAWRLCGRVEQGWREVRWMASSVQESLPEQAHTRDWQQMH